MDIQFSRAADAHLVVSNMVELIKYELEKITFIVSSVYNDTSCKTIHDILLDLIQKDGESHC